MHSLAVVLAAGEGTRMKSSLPKVLHPLAGRPMLGHVLAAVDAAGVREVAVVIGPGQDDVAAYAREVCPYVSIHCQAERRGTADAVLAARSALANQRDLIVLYGDTPLVAAEALRALQGAIDQGCAIAVTGFETAEPQGYGRLVLEQGAVRAIVEEHEATPEQRAITLCNGGLMALSGQHALALLEAVGNHNAKEEFYLTDVVAIAHSRGLRTAVQRIAEAEVLGVNDRVQLAAAEAAMQTRLRREVMLAGATLVAPETVFLSFDTVIGRDVFVEPWCWFGPEVRVEEGAVIHAFSHLVGAQIGAGALVGPFARMRPGTRLGPKAKVGNFVEVKAARIGAGAKVNHLSYIGNASVGKGSNVGAGTITCNYDGYRKAQTEIGANAFIGSNTALVAPVRIGDGATIGAGSVITRDVGADALAVARGRQMEIPGWSASFRARSKAKKDAPKKG